MKLVIIIYTQISPQDLQLEEFTIRNEPIDTNWMVKKLERREKTNGLLSML